MICLDEKKAMISDEEVKALDKEYCSWGDTVHYSKDPKVFAGCEGSFMYDSKDTPYLDLQMMYSACNFGYKNKRITDAVIDQMNTLPQLTPKFIQPYKSLLSAKMAKMIEDRFHEKGRMHFNVGGAQANEDAIKVVRNYTHRNGFFAFQGGYHGRTIAASCLTSSFRYREKYGHFGDRANFVPFPYCFRCPYGMKCDSCNHFCVKQFARQFESEYKAIYDPKTGECEYKAFIAEPILGTGGYINPPEWYFKELKQVLDEHNIMLVIDEVQMGMFRTGKWWAIENYGVVPDVMTFAKSITNGMNPLAGFWAKEKFIAPDVFTPGSAHSTYCSNPIGVRAAYEVMNIVEEEQYDFDSDLYVKISDIFESNRYPEHRVLIIQLIKYIEFLGKKYELEQVMEEYTKYSTMYREDYIKLLKAYYCMIGNYLIKGYGYKISKGLGTIYIEKFVWDKPRKVINLTESRRNKQKLILVLDIR